jgi:hypothetical protein
MGAGAGVATLSACVVAGVAGTFSCARGVASLAGAGSGAGGESATRAGAEVPGLRAAMSASQRS